MVDGLVVEEAVENVPIAEQEVPKLDFSSPKTVEEDATLAKQSVVDEETDGEGSTSEGEGGDSDGNGDKQELFTMAKLVPTVEDTNYRFFENVLASNPKVLHLNAGKYDLDNQFFLDLAAYQKWVSTQLADMRRYSKKGGAYNSRLGFLTKEGRTWGVEVDKLYAPMIWNGNHWVGLCISLTDWRVLVLDLNPRLKDMAAVWDGAYSLEPFTVERMGGAYENHKSGDCGPVALKFMELHALANPHLRMDGLTDELVDILRKQWAMNLYKDWVVPVYVGDEMQ
ncbi:hypothetical protein F2Q69_00007691 [Brassica cretica]|uniref:Ubiquitin-like protease family profile domain-containing protein n=1 Tax=Brassica cretica TaxID=69181 RepID=A0A8S9NZU5_BRACR|nr:hypothetical protein F2Q69_00007691 [Brassica cretica]